MMRMVDRIESYSPAGGSKGLGLVVGKVAVDPGFWFFKAHFYQDPVWPGSLGLESFLQLLKFAAKMEKESGLRFNILVRLPANPREVAFNEGLLEAANFIGAHIDLVVTASRAESDHDGSVVVAGLTSEVGKAVVMAISSPYDSNGKSDFADANGREATGAERKILKELAERFDLSARECGRPELASGWAWVSSRYSRMTADSKIARSPT